MTISCPSTQKFPHTKFAADVQVEEMFFMEKKHCVIKVLTNFLSIHNLLIMFC